MSSSLTLDGITRQLDPGLNAWLEILAYASEVFASEAVVRTRSTLFPWLDRLDFYRSGAAHANARGSFRGHDPKKVCAHATNLVKRFGNPCDRLLRGLGITRSPHKEKKQGKNMSDEAVKKATAATAETIDEVFQEAMRSYEKALKSGIQLQEESVNLWKDLLTKLGSPEDFQTRLESMTCFKTEFKSTSLS
jgi:hypothetical protein